MDVLDRLLDHDRWATDQLLDLSRGLTDAQLDEPFDIGHRTLRATFAHLIFNVAAWTAGMNGQATAAVDDSSVAALIERHADAFDTFAAFAHQIRDAGRLDDTFDDSFGGQMTFGGAILHVILHDEDHRTEALHILQRLRGPDMPEIEVDHGLWDFKRRGL